MKVSGILVAVAGVLILGCQTQASSSDALNDDACELIVGWVVDDTLMCIDMSSGVDMGCMDTTSPHSDLMDCYENLESGIRAVTHQIFPELLSQGWRNCDSDWSSNLEMGCP